ncbi:hypothetical protein CGRA01v4_06028 [Colletotrichum graminicola]|nr:hypothetical protein CGRA01v4_06028 [Colletotrichum graminicola]
MMAPIEESRAGQESQSRGREANHFTRRVWCTLTDIRHH